jgi:hypothetical protein
MSVIPVPYVHCLLTGGPHDGETVMTPWPRIELQMVTWEGNTAIPCFYILAAPWRGQSIAHYEFAESADALGSEPRTQ